MLMESVFALDVGAAASRIFNRAIMYCGKLGSMACRNKVKKIMRSLAEHSNHVAHVSFTQVTTKQQISTKSVKDKSKHLSGTLEVLESI